MFNRLSNILSSKFSRKDDLSRQVEIAQVLDLCRREFKTQFPNEEVRVMSLKNKILSVEVSSSALASEVRLREQIIISKINTMTGQEALKKIVYRLHF